MIDPRSTYKLNEEEFNQAVDILQKENANRLTIWQQRIFSIFNYSIYIWVISLIIFFTLFILYDDLPESIINIIKPVIVYLAPTGVVISFLLNIPVYKKFRRQIQLMRNLGILNTLKDQSRIEKRKVRIINILRLNSAIFAGITCVFAVIEIINKLVRKYTHSSNFSEYYIIPNWWEDILVLFIPLIVFTVISISLVFIIFMNKYKKRIDFAISLKNSLENYKTQSASSNSDYIEVSADKYQNIAQIERDQITLDRMLSVEHAFKEKDFGGFSVQKSQEAHLKLKDLDISINILINDFINELSLNPEKAIGSIREESGLTRIHVPDTNYEIYYKIDELSKNINIVAINNNELKNHSR
jgi:mRNA-degrading endonuclease RelE of RelBE toxin-antitoxin system